MIIIEVEVLINRVEPNEVFELAKSAAQLIGKPTLSTIIDENQDPYLAIKQTESFLKQYCYQQWQKEFNYPWIGENTAPSESTRSGAFEDCIIYDENATNFNFTAYLKAKFDNFILSPTEVNQLVKDIINLIKSEGSTVHNTLQGHCNKFDLKVSNEITSHCDFYFTSAAVPDQSGTPFLTMYWCACFYKVNNDKNAKH
ncbi:1985_t:CDS:2 [Funneliformis geosporum]|uniref:22_t:CDS:1 n=1 Tax=Funneliformis geosporum TaxID=1117311 RepID=A0A9W4SEB3_9GLOM|nr:1985_t:CDS:2 [Funneliformis geosporum]CAI2165819.1 22_t:CDS:2 [Funneliformis geosporum]